MSCCYCLQPLQFLTSGHSDAQGWSSDCPDVKNYQWWLNLVWHGMLYSCTHMATVGVKGLKLSFSAWFEYLLPAVDNLVQTDEWCGCWCVLRSVAYEQQRHLPASTNLWRHELVFLTERWDGICDYRDTYTEADPIQRDPSLTVMESGPWTDRQTDGRTDGQSAAV